MGDEDDNEGGRRVSARGSASGGDTAAGGPAFYATGRENGGWRSWLSLLHPPYTAWHLGYVAIGAALAHPLRYDRLAESLLAFFLALGIGAHALDELSGHPLRTGIADRALLSVGVACVAGAGAIGWFVGGWHLVPFIGVGGLLAFGYNLEWFGGRLHNAAGFASAWGAFPVLTGYFAQHWTMSAAAIVAAAAAAGLSLAQRILSTQARWWRRRVRDFSGIASLTDGTRVEVSPTTAVTPIEQALKLIALAVVVLAVGLVVAGR